MCCQVANTEKAPGTSDVHNVFLKGAREKSTLLRFWVISSILINNGMCLVKRNPFTSNANRKHIPFLLAEKILINSMGINYLYFSMETYFML